MPETRPIQDDEIDLFDLFEMLWAGKRVIILFIAVAILAAGLFLFFNEAKYESRLVYSVVKAPPFLTIEETSSDFQQKFLSKDVFESWKTQNPAAEILFDDISDSELFQGFLIAKNRDNRLVLFSSERNGDAFILVRTNQLSILNDFHNYASHVSEMLKNDYISRAREDLFSIEKRYQALTSADESILAYIISYNSFINAGMEGGMIVSIGRPSIPKKVSPRSILILGLSAMLGGMVGVIYLIFLQAVRKRKEKLAPELG